MMSNLYSVNSQRFNFVLNGAKPYTQYTVYSDGYNLSCRVKPFGRNLGESLISDQSGKLNFSLFYLDVPEQTGIINNFPSVASKTTDVQSDKILYIVDPTGTSIITKVIPFTAGSSPSAYNLTS